MSIRINTIPQNMIEMTAREKHKFHTATVKTAPINIEVIQVLTPSLKNIVIILITKAMPDKIAIDSIILYFLDLFLFY